MQNNICTNYRLVQLSHFVQIRLRMNMSNFDGSSPVFFFSPFRCSGNGVLGTLQLPASLFHFFFHSIGAVMLLTPGANTFALSFYLITLHVHYKLKSPRGTSNRFSIFTFFSENRLFGSCLRRLANDIPESS